jgi:hypothetical protein
MATAGGGLGAALNEAGDVVEANIGGDGHRPHGEVVQGPALCDRAVVAELRSLLGEPWADLPA